MNEDIKDNQEFTKEVESPLMTGEGELTSLPLQGDATSMVDLLTERQMKVSLLHLFEVKFRKNNPKASERVVKRAIERKAKELKVEKL